jgi:hypothetical protein
MNAPFWLAVRCQARPLKWKEIKRICYYITESGIIITTIEIKFFGIVVRLLKAFNNISLPHDLISRPGFTTDTWEQGMYTVLRISFTC